MFGNPLIPMHLALHAIPTQIALEKNIPLILWGKIQHMNMEVQNPTKVNLWITSGEKFFGVNEGKSIDYWVNKNF